MADIIEFKPHQPTQENPEQAAKHAAEQREAEDFAAQIGKSSENEFVPQAPEATAAVPTAQELVDKKRVEDPVAAHSEAQIQKLVAELESAPDKVAILNRWMKGVEAKQIDPGDVLEAQARAKFDQAA